MTRENREIMETLMVEDVTPEDDAFENVTDAIEDIFAVDAGKGIADGGATKPVMGKTTWKSWMHILASKGKLGSVHYVKCERRFRFGNNNILVARQMVTFRVMLFGEERVLSVFLVDGGNAAPDCPDVS